MSFNASSSSDPFVQSLISSGGETGRMIAGFDWSGTSIGPIATWSQSLRTAVGLLLRSPVALVMLWNEDGVMLYNDAYSVFAGNRHPQLLGSKVREGWPEVADFNDNIMKVCLAGGTLAYRDHVLSLNRTGTFEEVFLDLDYSPVPDDNGQPAGVIAFVVEITQRVLAERRERAERERFLRLFEQAPSFMAVLSGPKHRFDYVNPRYKRLIGGREVVGQDLSDALPEVVEQGFLALLDKVYATGEPFNALGNKVMLRTADDETVRPHYLDFVYQPMRDVDGSITGIFVEGSDVTDNKRAEMRIEALVRLSDAIRDLSDPAEISYEAARVLGETMEVSRAGYGIIDTETETITIERDWNARGIKTLAGTLHFRDYGSYIEDLKRGETAIVSNAYEDPRTAATADALKAISAQAFVNMPVTERGKSVALLYLNHEAGRDWSEEDLDLIGEFAERTRGAVERARSDRELRDLNASLERQVIERSAVGGQFWQISSDLLCILKADGYLGSFNPAWSRILGYDDEALSRMSFRDLLHPDDIERTVTRFQDLIQGQPIPRFENRYIKKNGSVMWIAWAAAPYGDAFYCAGRDITEEKAAEAEREQLWTFSQDMLARANYSGGMTAVNPAWTQVLGWSEDELLTNPYADIIDPADLPATAAALMEMGETGLPTRFENRILSKDGVWTPIGWTVSPEPDGVNFIAVGRDLTEDKARERALLQAQEALRQSQKMEAVGQLTGGIAHDFNNMLAVVMGSLDLLGRRISDEDPRARRYVDAAMEGAKRAASLTQRLLAFSRQQPLQPESIDPNRLVAGMSDLLRHSIGADVRLETVLTGGSWRIHVDPNQLESVILNLAVNARDAMPGGGRLTIETQNTHLDARYVAAEMGVPAGHYVMIAISDTGTGMTPEVIAKAFDPFFTTKAIGKGTGLGLSQVYGFVKQSGGHVKIYSEPAAGPNQGTTVKIYLPRDTEHETAQADETGANDIPTGEDREIILVVDDEPAVRQFSVDAMTELGYGVLEADSAAAALRLLQAHPEIALLFTDIVMPDTNGRQLADAARVFRPDLKVLYTTGYTRNAVVHNGVVDAGVELIGKPFTIDELAARLRACLDAG